MSVFTRKLTKDEFLALPDDEKEIYAEWRQKDMPEQFKGKGFKPGVSGNPKGKVKGAKSIKQSLAQLLKDNPTDYALAKFTEKYPDADIRTNADMLGTVLLAQAKEGNLKAIQTVLKYIDALPKQHIAISKEEFDVALPDEETFMED